MHYDLVQTNIDVEKINDFFDSKDYQELQLRLICLEKSCKKISNLQMKGIEENLTKLSQQIKEPFSKISALIDDSWINKLEEVQFVFDGMFSKIKKLNDCVELKGISSSMFYLTRVFENYRLLYFTSAESNEKNIEDKKATEKIITEIFQPDAEKAIDNEQSPIITLSPVNDKVLKYLSEHPESFYQLTDNDFEVVMAEIYSKLGYDVTRTKATRDGGKDLIIRIPEILGDFIYYVECKKYNLKRPIGVGIIRNLVGTVNTDRVNGGILATTSYFTRDANDFIINNNLSCQIKMHDYDVIRDLLKKTV